MKKIIIAVLLSVVSMSALANRTWIAISDSIGSGVPQGQSWQHAFSLVSAERNIYIRNLSSPGSSLGDTRQGGFNNPNTAAAINMIAGANSAYCCVLVMAGLNDWGSSVPWQNTATSLRFILQKVRNEGKKAMVMSPIWNYREGIANADGLTLSDYRIVLANVCIGEFPDVCHFAKKSNTIMGSSAAAPYFDANEVAEGKQTHPNAQGHRYLADWIIQEGASAGLF